MTAHWDDLRQRRRWLKRTLLRPVGRPALRWSQGRAPVPVRSWMLRKAAFPYLRARDDRFERDVGHGVFAGTTRDMLSLYVLTFGVWEPYLSAFITGRLRSGDVFVDVGANSGWYTVLGSRAVGEGGLVVAIEPAGPLLERLRAQVERNGLTNVVIVPEAVSDHHGRVAVEVGPAEHTGLTRALRDSDGEASVACRPLPEMVDPDVWRRVRLVKIDVEGAEFAAVRGLRGRFADLSDEAEIIVEVGPERASSPSEVAELFSIFERAGFSAYAVPNEYGVRHYLERRPLDALTRLDPAAVSTEVNVVFSRFNGRELPVH